MKIRILTSRHLRNADTAARLGGDEFAVLVESMYRADEAVMIAERILKIDKSFIDKLGQGSEGNAVARAIIMMGNSLNLKTIAEGIEHPEQIDELQLPGCEAGQGFHFAKPLTVGDMDEFLLNRYAPVSG